MPTVSHEALVYLLRERPSLIPELVQGALGVALPAFTDISLSDSSFTQLVPTEYRADLTVVLQDADQNAVAAIIVEVQLAADQDKRFSWPIYGATLYARLKCPVYLLVVTPSAAVATWARRLADQPAVVTLVLGPHEVPIIVDPATPNAELAVLSVMAPRERREHSRHRPGRAGLGVPARRGPRCDLL